MRNQDTVRKIAQTSLLLTLLVMMATGCNGTMEKSDPNNNFAEMRAKRKAARQAQNDAAQAQTTAQ